MHAYVSARVCACVCVCVCALQPHHDQVDQGHCVEADAPQPHDAEHVDQDHGDGEADEGRGPHLEAQQHRGHHEDGPQRHAQVERRVVGNGEVLLVEHVEDAAQGGTRETDRQTDRRTDGQTDGEGQIEGDR